VIDLDFGVKKNAASNVIDTKTPDLAMKIFNSENKGADYRFTCEKKEILFGRSGTCDVEIKDKLLSRIQGTFEFKDGYWVISDGYMGRNSTNGVWM
jgi:hypothetical protein